MSFFSNINKMSKKDYSSDPEIEEMQLKAEQLNIFEIIKNIANKGDNTKDEANIIEWEECRLAYKQKIYVGTIANIDSTIRSGFSVSRNTYLTMKDGTVLFCSENRIGQGIVSREYITAFRNGKWVDRLKAYSEKLTEEHKKSLIEQNNKEKEEKEEKLAPFSNIDF